MVDHFAAIPEAEDWRRKGGSGYTPLDDTPPVIKNVMEPTKFSTQNASKYVFDELGAEKLSNMLPLKPDANFWAWTRGAGRAVGNLGRWLFSSRPITINIGCQQNTFLGPPEEPKQNVPPEPIPAMDEKLEKADDDQKGDNANPLNEPEGTNVDPHVEADSEKYADPDIE